MTTIKSYTDINQSKKLAEILPLESADMYYCYGMDIKTKEWSYDNTPTIIDEENKLDIGDIPCWSLAALLGVLNEIKPLVYTPILFPSEGKWILQFAEYGHGNICEVTCDNPVDACYEMIIKLHELKML